jgi:lipopolysaccharide heptosyltransferase I
VKILLLKPSSLGDVIHAVPVLRLIKRHLPESQIYWWLDKSLTPLLEGDPDLAGIIPFDRKRWANPRFWPEAFQSVQTTRAMHFDWAIDLQGLARSAIFGWLANADNFFGLDNLREGAREGARGFYDLTPPRSPDGAHAVDRYLSILPLLKIPTHWDFQWLPVRTAAQDSIQHKWHPSDSRWIAIIPGGRWDNKRWPADSFAQTVRRLSKTTDARFVILGGKEDQSLGRTIAEAVPGQCLDLTGKTSLPEMIEWMRVCSLAISNDTGPMHVAAAVHTPVIGLFGPTDPYCTGPYCQIQNVLTAGTPSCAPCFKSRCHYHRDPMACMRAITPAMVCAKASSLLKTQ